MLIIFADHRLVRADCADDNDGGANDDGDGTTRNSQRTNELSRVSNIIYQKKNDRLSDFESEFNFLMYGIVNSRSICGTFLNRGAERFSPITKDEERG